MNHLSEFDIRQEAELALEITKITDENINAAFGLYTKDEIINERLLADKVLVQVIRPSIAS